MPTATPTIYTTAHFLNKLHSRRLAGRPNVMLAVRNMMQANINSKNTNTCRDYGYTSTRQDFALRIRDAIKNDTTEHLLGIDMPRMTPQGRRSLFSNLQDKRGWDLFQCSHCRTVADESESVPTSGGDDERICQPCSNDGPFSYSDQEDCYVHEDNVVHVYRSRRRSFIVSSGYADGNYCWSEHIDEWCTEDYHQELEDENSNDDDDDDDDRDSGSNYGRNPFDPNNAIAIGSYHSSKSYTQFVPGTTFEARQLPLYVGIELEIEAYPDADRQNLRNCAQQIKRLLNGINGDRHYALCEEDGSIRNGFEVVTGWTGLDVHETTLQALRSEEFQWLVKQYSLRSHDTTTCGLHVTIDRACMTSLHLSKMIVFANHPQNYDFITKVCRREPSPSYSRTKGHIYSKVGKVIGNQEHDRYEIINTSHNHVLEFRGPRGTLKFESVMATMEFARMMWLFSRDAAITKLSQHNFIEFVWLAGNSQDTKYLRPYLIQLGLAPKEVPAMNHDGRLTLTEAWQEAVRGGHIAITVDR